MIHEMERIQPIVQHPQYRAWIQQMDELERDRKYCKHGLSHLLDVARIASLLAQDRKLTYPRDMIYAAALLHDLGRLQQYTTGEPHAQAGIPMAQEMLAHTSFTQIEQQQILQAVSSHRNGDTCDSLAQLIFEADHASRMCFVCEAANTCYWSQERRNQTVLL